MIQQEILQYQRLDIELNKIERELKKNPYFLRRKELRAALEKGEEQLARLEQKTLDLRNQLAQATQTVQKINAMIAEYAKEISDIEDIDELKYMNKKLDEQFEALANVEREIKQIVRDGEELEKSYDTIMRVQRPKLAAEYKRCGEEVDKATEAVKPRVLELRKQQAELKKNIDPALFERYKRLSEQVLPVFVPLQNGNQCGGCRMEMPLAQVTANITEKGYMVCEHCGRIIYKD